MKVLVTGASGFAGRWLRADLEAAGHEVIAAPGRTELDLATNPDFRPVIEAIRPDAVAHLAAVSYGPDAARDPDIAMRVNAGGTAALFAALDEAGSDAAVLVTGSADVYGVPDPNDLPLRESAPLRAHAAYGRSKVAQERVASDARATGRRVVVSRSFNHIGPGQREVFVAPAMAQRALSLRDGRLAAIPVGNLQVRRDFTDVRDTVRAYRLLLEALVDGRAATAGTALNVSSGKSVSISGLLEVICRIVGVDMTTITDPAQIRPNDPPEVRGDATALHNLTGWAPSIPLATTIVDLVRSLEARR